MNLQCKYKEVKYIKEKYPKGTRIELISMGDDPRPIEKGSKGTVESVDDIGTVHCKFDNGRCLGLINGIDKFKIIDESESE